MQPQYIHLTHIEPAQLDMALAAGWFRIQQTLFTTDELIFDGIQYETIWLRVRLNDFITDKKHRALLKKNHAFRTEIRKLRITEEHDDLYEEYKKHIPFESSSSLHSLLLGNGKKNAFNTWLINVYDGHKLIGTGGFDLGKQSAAGIFSVFDPEYKRYSLGKYMIYEKMRFCKEEGLTYFYPGYFVPGYAPFDYKKEIGKNTLEFYSRLHDEWFSLFGREK